MRILTKRTILYLGTLIGGFATTVFTAMATKRALEVSKDETLTPQEKTVEIVKAYAIPATTAVGTVVAGAVMIDGYNAALGQFSSVINERERVMFEYRQEVRDHIGTQNELNVMSTALYNAVTMPPKEVFYSLKPGECVFVDSIERRYFVMNFDKFNRMNASLAAKINSGGIVDANFYKGAVGFPKLAWANDLGWYRSFGEKPWDQFKYTEMYTIMDGSRELGKMCILHEYNALPPKKKEVIDVEHREID